MSHQCHTNVTPCTNVEQKPVQMDITQERQMCEDTLSHWPRVDHHGKLQGVTPAPPRHIKSRPSHPPAEQRTRTSSGMLSTPFHTYSHKNVWNSHKIQKQDEVAMSTPCHVHTLPCPQPAMSTPCASVMHKQGEAEGKRVLSSYLPTHFKSDSKQTTAARTCSHVMQRVSNISAVVSSADVQKLIHVSPANDCAIWTAIIAAKRPIASHMREALTGVLDGTCCGMCMEEGEEPSWSSGRFGAWRRLGIVLLVVTRHACVMVLQKTFVGRFCWLILFGRATTRACNKDQHPPPVWRTKARACNAN
eukprot:366400-Chlamydomonas_euryale.AAC.13